jgi:hypothetical protein
MRASIWPAEIDRLAALQRYRIWDTQPEDCFDTITRLASQFFKSPVSWISLMGANRQWFKSVIGLNVREHPREGSLCARTISEGAPLVVRDAAADLQFAENLLVTGEPHIRFYAGIPLQTPDGYNIGTLCVADAEPRGCTDKQMCFLKELSRLVLLQLEARVLRLDAEAVHRKAMVRSFTGSSDPDSSDSSQSDPLLAAAHHIRTPLNGIFAAADLLALTELTPEQREYLEIVRTSSRNLLNLAAEALKQFEGAQPSPPAARQRLQHKHMLA